MKTDTDTKLRLAGIVNDSVVDGPGYRMTVFVQGCPHKCNGCHNPETHDPEKGYLSDINLIFEKYRQNPLLSGITLSGGEPFLWAEQLSILAEMVKAEGHSVWTYTGFTFEKLLELGRENPELMRLLSKTDVLVDGPFILDQRTLTLKFRGSKNQRLVDVPKSLNAGQAVLWEN